LSELIDVAVVGAGPYGLSIAAHLRERRLKLRIFGDPMEMWLKHMPQGMMLKSDAFASDLFDPQGKLPLRAYCAAHGLPYGDARPPVTLETFCAYGLWFQQCAVPELERARVRNIDRAAGGFALALDGGETVLARNVVLAVGVSHFAYLPPELAQLPPEFASHSSAHSDPAALKGKQVLVLGAGASAIDLAMLMGEAGVSVRLAARAEALKFHSGIERPPSVWRSLRHPKSPLGPGLTSYAYSYFPHIYRRLPENMRLRILGRALGPSAGWTVRPRIEGKVPFLLGRRLVRAEPAGGRLALRFADREGGEEEILVDHLVAATGYQADSDRLDFLAPSLRGALRRTGTAPQLDGGFQSSEAGLYFAGLAAAATFGPALRFAWGAGFNARRLARVLG